MYNRILVPLDGSALAERILPHATEIARRFGSTLVLLHAVTGRIEALTQAAGADPVAAAPVSAEVAEDVFQAEAGSTEDYFARLVARLRAEGVAVEPLIVEGSAVATLAQAVVEQRIDLVAMTTQGRSALGRLFLGSVPESLIEEIDVPALLLRADK